jgi:5-methylthioribose kinase
MTGASRAQAKFCERQQALLHGDLHTGSIMATQVRARPALHTVCRHAHRPCC